MQYLDAVHWNREQENQLLAVIDALVKCHLNLNIEKTKTVTEKYWDWELANETKSICMRNPKEVAAEKYNEFYKKAFNEFLDPLTYTHFTIEGEVEFRSVLYIPGMDRLSTEDVMHPKTKNIRLYVKRVFISDDFDDELFPRYLSFVKGVVNSNDLPLNVSREILQESRIVRIMKKHLVRKTFDMIRGIMQSENKEDYKKFWENFGKYIKLGCLLLLFLTADVDVASLIHCPSCSWIM